MYHVLADMFLTWPIPPIIASSLCFYVVSYYLLKNYLVRWTAQAIFGDKIRLVGTQNQTSVANGKANHHDDSQSELVILNEGDILKISNLCLSVAIAILTLGTGLIGVWETRHDLLHAQSRFVIPVIHFDAWYFVCDTYTYYKAFVVRKNVIHLPLLKKIYLYCKIERAVLIHHVILLSIGYPVAGSYALRHGWGDFFIAAFMVQDLSNPFQHMAVILRILKQQKSTLYIINGLVLIPVYFAARILNLPLQMYFYAAQSFNGSIIEAMKSMFFICHAFNFLLFLLQFVWFTAIVRIAYNAVVLRFLRGDKTEGDSKIKKSN